MIIRDVVPQDRAQWAVLWQGYLEFYQVPGLAAAVTARTWARFFDVAEPVHALVAEQDAQLVGLVHYIFHRNTWNIENVCYLEDLFTAPAARGKGVGRALIEGVYAKAQAHGAASVYWHTHETNLTAQALYNKVAQRTGFIQYKKNF